jgi:hypothetical protein
MVEPLSREDEWLMVRQIPRIHKYEFSPDCLKILASVYTFENANDALLFKLTWGGQ